ncbi:MAG: hypothetical protein FWE98_04285 [Oscillospiraceae bacterium]|nr:hypothetical protein [Oscillospiraceae bacterium]
MKNAERALVRILKEICSDEAIDLASFSHDWILRLQKGDRLAFLFGYNFGVNNAACARICDDKSAASEILAYTGIPAVEHHFFMTPLHMQYVGENGNWARIVQLLEEHGALVCKANEGTGGNAVCLVKDRAQLEKAVHRIFSQHQNLAVSPYCEILKEYRVVVLKGAAKLAYAKHVPYVVGDGESSIRELLLNFMRDAQTLISVELDDAALDKVLESGAIRNLNWKSNLGQGASPEIVESGALLSALSDLAARAAGALSIDFASVDIVDTPEGMKVLEVNCGIMMENFIRSAPENYATAKSIYREAVLEMLGGT